MTKIVLRLGLIALAVVAASSPARARCRDSLQPATPAEAARYLLANADRVGFATVTALASPIRQRAETLDMLFPIKGAAGIVTMAPGWRGREILIGSTGTSVGAPQGALVFVALRETAQGAVVDECLARAMAAHDRSELIRAAFELSRGR